MNTMDSTASSKAGLDRIGVLSAHNLFTLDGALAIISAVAFMALAPQLLSFHGIGVSPGSVLMTRLVAGFLLAAGITQLRARAAAKPPLRKLRHRPKSGKVPKSTMSAVLGAYYPRAVKCTLST